MADRAVAAGRPGRIGDGLRQLHGDRAAGRGPQAPRHHLAQQGRPPLRRQPRGHGVQLRGGPQQKPDGAHGRPGGRRPDGATHRALPPQDVAAGEPALHLVAESYGGKFAVTTALAALKAIRQGRLHAKLGGVALGDSWISPEDSVLSWGPLLYQLSRIDEKGLQQCNSLAQQIKAQLKAKQYAAAEKSWEKLESAVHQHSNNVNFYNILKDNSATDAAAVRKVGYTSYLSSKATREGGLDGLMNAEVKAKLGVVPQNFTWGEQAGDVFEALRGDFMNPRINEVDELLKLGVEVTIYSGGTRIFTAQLDLICATKGTLDWVQKLKWEGLKKFTDAPRKPVYCKVGEAAGTQAFVKSYKNLKFYWILGSGHMVPIDNPCPALEMLGDITHSPAG
ncbi:hypothetical protein VPH35_139838 [Triticum aestivum]